jgi:acylphosphatase
MLGRDGPVSNQRRIRIVVTGLVQGVYFRASTVEVATSLGLVGSVRNLPNGCVEIDAQGDPDKVENLLEWARQGPPSARVDNVDLSELELNESLKVFSIRR